MRVRKHYQIPQECCAHLQLLHGPAQRRLTIRSTGPIAACRHLGYKILAQMPAHRNGPVSSNVRRRHIRQFRFRHFLTTEKGRILISKIKLAVVVLSFATQNSIAQNAPSVQEVTKGVIKSARNYASAISCGDAQIDSKNIAGLIPYKTLEDRLDAKFAVLWAGDIGCAGGSGTEGTNISIVTIGAGDAYMVDPQLSSPIIGFESPVRFVERIVGNTKDTLILEGKEQGPKDANCCPSIPVRFTLKADPKGNWKMIEKKIMPAKK